MTPVNGGVGGGGGVGWSVNEVVRDKSGEAEYQMATLHVGTLGKKENPSSITGSGFNYRSAPVLSVTPPTPNGRGPRVYIPTTMQIHETIVNWLCG